jgi:hypothetical protein
LILFQPFSPQATPPYFSHIFNIFAITRLIVFHGWVSLPFIFFFAFDSDWLLIALSFIDSHFRCRYFLSHSFHYVRYAIERHYFD